ncbi:MAG: caspase family protein [Ferruginibacter sp.]
MSARLKPLFLTVLIFLSPRLHAQIFYETQWKIDNITYTGLMIYYNTNDALMRVHYTINNDYKVVEFKCQYKKLNMNGREGYILDGIDAKFMYSKNGAGIYSSDNFYFYKVNEGYGLPYTIDDYHLGLENPSKYMTRVDRWQEIPTSTFTEKYVRNFFEKDEAMYSKLLAYNVQTNKVANGYRISSSTYSANNWFVCMSKGTGITDQSAYKEKDFPTEWIRNNWAEKKEISNVSYGDGEWLVVMSANAGISTQTYNSQPIFPEDWVKEKWVLGYRITSLTYGNGNWLVVMSKGTVITEQKYYVNDYFPADWIKDRWAENYRVNGMACGGGKWVLIMSQNLGIGEQMYKKLSTYPSEFVKESWSKSYEISNAAYGNGEWCIVMSQNTGITQQSYNVTQAYPRDWVQGKWDGKEQVAVAANVNTVAPVTNAKIHLIMVANTMINDIGVSCKVDEERVMNEFEIFAKELDMSLDKKVIDGNVFSRPAVDAALNDLNPSPNDIVVFIYSGHGFRWADQTNQYPSISLKYSSYEQVAQSNSYLLEDIYNKIISKGARLNIVLGDCCNSQIGISSRGGDFALSSRTGNNGNSNKLRQLFLSKKGNMIIAAASPNETSCGNSRDGGYLISSFFQAIGKETSYLNNDTPDWDHVIANALTTARFSTLNLSSCTTQNGMHYSTIK